MNVKKKILAAPLLLLVAANAMAVPCTATQPLGILGPPALELFGNTFSAPGAYTDCFTFTLAGTANLQGGSVLQDPLSYLNIDTTFSLFEGDPLLADVSNQIGSSFGPGSFSFSGLTAGLYSLVADSNVVRGGFGLPLQVGYFGQLLSFTAPSPPTVPETPTTSVPEPGTLALLLAGLAAVLTVRRQRASGNSSIAS